jgi:hypothetical protein
MSKKSFCNIITPDINTFRRISNVLIASHGITDIIEAGEYIELHILYAMYFLICRYINFKILYVMFYLHTTLHFSEDIENIPLTILFVFFLSTLEKYYSEIILHFYMLFVHLPIHYSRISNILYDKPEFSFVVISLMHIISWKYLPKNPTYTRTNIGIICAHVAFTSLNKV